MMNELKNKVVVITGGASGIGASFARRFSEEGARIEICDLQQDRVDHAVGELSRAGAEVSGTVCDVTDRASVERFADDVWQRHGRVDIILNNAGAIAPQAPVLEAKREDIENVFDINVFGMLNSIQVFGKRLVAQGTPAAILIVGSENSLFDGIPLGSAYVASKHTMLAFSDALRKELPEFIQTSFICPGIVSTKLTKRTEEMGMDVDLFTRTIMPQLKAGRFFAVSHAYNVVPIRQRYDEILAAYAEFAPRYEGDIEFDVRDMSGRSDS